MNEFQVIQMTIKVIIMIATNEDKSYS
jgi:hypothetical protein